MPSEGSTAGGGRGLRSSIRGPPVGDRRDRLRALDRVLERAVALHGDPELQRDRAGVAVDVPHAPPRDDRVAEQHGGAELRLHPSELRAGKPLPHARGEMAHREHAVRDHAWKPDRTRERVVLMERVLIARGVRVRLYVLPYDDALPRLQLRAGLEVGHALVSGGRTTSVHRAETTVSPASSTISVATTRSSLPALERIDSMDGVAVRTSPTAIGRLHS